MKKELKKLIRTLRNQGVRVELQKSGHYKAYPPEGPVVVFGSTESDHRAMKNTKARLRRGGCNV